MIGCMKQKLLVAMIAVVVGLSLAQKVDINKAMSALKQDKQVTLLKEVKLPPPPPQRSAEKKYEVRIRNEADEVFNYVIFLAAPKGKRYFNLYSVRFEDAYSFDNALYGFGYLTGFLMRACLGLTEESTKKLVSWFSEKVEQIQEKGIGDFSRDFGPVEMSLMGGVRFDKSGHLIVVLQRKGEPGKNWPRWCEQ